MLINSEYMNKKKETSNLWRIMILIILCTISADEYAYSSIPVKQTKSTVLSKKQRWF